MCLVRFTQRNDENENLVFVLYDYLLKSKILKLFIDNW